MRDPYLLFGARLVSAAPDHLSVFEQAMTDIETLLGDGNVTELKSSGVYVAPVSPGKAEQLWISVSGILTAADTQIGDDGLQWFAHLADRRGCELAYN